MYTLNTDMLKGVREQLLVCRALMHDDPDAAAIIELEKVIAIIDGILESDEQVVSVVWMIELLEKVIKLLPVIADFIDSLK